MDYQTIARNDNNFITTLIDNGEWERAYYRAELLVGAIKQAMRQQGIAFTPRTIHDSTPR